MNLILIKYKIKKGNSISSNSQNPEKYKSMGIWIVIIIIVTALSFILALIVNPFWWILLPLSLFMLIIVKIMSPYFWLEKKTCPACNSPIGKYSETCRKCGTKLMAKCLSCGKYLPVGTKFCDNCNIELEHPERDRVIFKPEIIDKSTPLPENPKVCSNCGTELKNPEIIRYCEECGAKVR